VKKTDQNNLRIKTLEDIAKDALELINPQCELATRIKVVLGIKRNKTVDKSISIF
jgi:hypothetical protein